MVVHYACEFSFFTKKYGEVMSFPTNIPLPDIVAVSKMRLFSLLSVNISLPLYRVLCDNFPTNVGGICFYINSSLTFTRTLYELELYEYALKFGVRENQSIEIRWNKKWHCKACHV